MKTSIKVLVVVLVVLTSSANGQDRIALDRSQIPAELEAQLKLKLPGKLQETDEVLIGERDELVGVLEAYTISPLLPLDPNVRIDNWSLDRLRSGQPKVQQVYGPKAAEIQLKEKIEASRIACNTSSSKKVYASVDACLKAKSVPEMERVLSAIILQPQCDSAAKSYLKYRSECSDACPPDGPQITKEFDAACLSSYVPWKRENGQYLADAEPNVFRTGGSSEGVKGVVDAVVLIQEKTDEGWRHLCGGLLLSGNRVLTALHCFQNSYDEESLNEQRLHVRLIREAGNKSYLLLPTRIEPLAQKPADDFIVLSFASPKILPAPKIVFREPASPEPAVVLGYFHDFDTQRVLQDSRTGAGVSRVDSAQQGLRWPKDGLCHVTSTVGGCVRSICQTIEGYSGSPMFGTSSSSDAPLEVFGIVSIQDHQSSQCGPTDQITTLLSAARGVKP